MEQLPYIDQHSIVIGATPERIWTALVRTVSSDLGSASIALTRSLGLQPARRRGDWRGTLQPGDAIRGFEVRQALPPRRLALGGEHRFARYTLEFELDEHAASDCILRASTRARFPGLRGGAYRALVIGSGAHRLLVKRLLRNIARRS